MTKGLCERCGAPPPVIKEGHFAGQSGMHDYCAHCSKDLCDPCLAAGRCRDSPDGKHHPETDPEDLDLSVEDTDGY